MNGALFISALLNVRRASGAVCPEGEKHAFLEYEKNYNTYCKNYCEPTLFIKTILTVLQGEFYLPAQSKCSRHLM